MAHVPEKTPPPPFPTPPKPNQPKLFLANYLFLIKQNKSKQQTTSKHINTSFIMFHKSKKNLTDIFVLGLKWYWTQTMVMSFLEFYTLFEVLSHSLSNT